MNSEQYDDEYGLLVALKGTRQQSSFISLKRIAEIIKLVFLPEEIEALIKYLKN
jgi:hypothetical protein